MLLLTLRDKKKGDRCCDEIVFIGGQNANKRYKETKN